MQSKKTIVQSSTFSLPYGVQLMISSKKKKKKNSLDLIEKVTNWGYLLISKI